MAQRLATEYVKACLVLTEAEMLNFIQIFADHQVQLQVKVYENGSQDVAFQDSGQDEIVLSFERKDCNYVFTGSCRLNSPNLVNAMRKAVALFKGSAVVNRIYPSYIMVYHYKQGAVTKIVEVKDTNEKIIYEFKDTLGLLEQLYQKQNVEFEIKAVQTQIDEMLDLRSLNAEPLFVLQIDQRLKFLSHQLFSLEA